MEDLYDNKYNWIWLVFVYFMFPFIDQEIPKEVNDLLDLYKVNKSKSNNKKELNEIINQLRPYVKQQFNKLIDNYEVDT